MAQKFHVLLSLIFLTGMWRGQVAASSPLVTQIVPLQLVSEGNAVSLYCDAATPDLPSKYEWWHNNERIANSDSPFYEVDVAGFADAGTYFTRVTTPAGVLTSSMAIVGVLESTERTVVAKAGGTASITVKAAGVGLSYEWQRNDGQPLAAPRYAGVRSPTLKISGAGADDAGQFYCEVTVHGGNDFFTATSGSYTLAVEDSRPEVDAFTLPDGAVAAYYTPLQVTASHSPTRFTISGLPSGLTCNPVTGVIEGIPTVAGHFTMTATASNPVGASQPFTTSFTISPINPGVVGTFSGLLNPNLDLTGFYGSCAVTINTAGSFTARCSFVVDRSGRLFTSSFKGRLSFLDPDEYTGESASIGQPFYVAALGMSDSRAPVHGIFTVDWNPAAGMTCRLSLYDGPNLLSIIESGVLGRNAWNTRTRPASSFMGHYTMEPQRPVSPYANNAGSGYASFTITSGGTFAFAGRLPDGSAFVFPAFIQEDGTSWVLAWLYRCKGMLRGWIQTAAGTPPAFNDNGVTGGLQWIRPPSTITPVEAIDNFYFYGIDEDITVQGARYLPPRMPQLTSPYMMNVKAGPPENIRVQVTGGRTGNASAASLSTSHMATFPRWVAGSSYLRFNSLSFNSGTGGFTGSATILAGTPSGGQVPLVTTTLQGVVTRDNPADPDGYGTGYLVYPLNYAIFNNDFTAVLQHIPVIYSASVKITAAP